MIDERMGVSERNFAALKVRLQTVLVRMPGRYQMIWYTEGKIDPWPTTETTERERERLHYPHLATTIS